ncbi:MAG: hypothetical protein RIM83_19305 [Allomuricauda sp.]
MVFFIAYGCSDNETPIHDETTKAPESKEVLTLLNSKKANDTPFKLPRESIIFEENLYVVDESKTYKYSFDSNSWETINAASEGVAVFPYLNYNISFIRNKKWHILNEYSLSMFDFTSNTWEEIKRFQNSDLHATIGVYVNETLYVFSDIIRDEIFKYDFENNELLPYSTFEKKPNYGQLVKSIYKIGESYYFTKLSDYNSISIYKWNNNFKTLEYINEYETEYIAQGSGFAYKDNIIFGLGGENSVDENGEITSFKLTDKFYYYNVTNNEFHEVKNSFYQGRFASLPIKHDDSFFLLGGYTILNNQRKEVQVMDQLSFKKTIEIINP